MSKTPARTCLDCPKPCRGKRCRACDGKHRAAMAKLNPPAVRQRPTKLAKRYRPPTPSEDTRPLTSQERDAALCIQVDTEIFFAEQGEGYHEAQSICSGCEIAARCLAANMNEEYGFYASSPPHRRRLRRRMAKETAPEPAEPWTAEEAS